MYKITYTKQAYKALRRIPKNVATSIRTKLDHIAKDPFTTHSNVTKLQNRPGYRLRAGDWRVIYEIRKEEIVILVLKIGSRGEIYK
ncbi:MAG: type II toxin-antitoxin system RelE/ParE family toxin [Anaerolineales bacterium]|nr:type II toxin-antitoxin system RelE/ParE family toxin [Anaerolineales bacterium]